MYTLTGWDYLVIVVMLIVSAAIGVFFAYRSRRSQSSSDYFLGGRGMSVFPVSMSLTATYISAITYLGTPAEVYNHGPKYGLMATLRLLFPLAILYWVIPVYYRLEITTVYEYLEMRFNNTVRFLVIASEFFGGFLYMGIVVYTPALALSTVTGMSLTFSILAIGVICTFYTTIGGIKAVIWTDVFQAAAMVLGASIMIIVGTIMIGGPAEGWRRAGEGQRTELVDFNVDPTIRLSFWSIYIGGTTFLVMIAGTKQSFVQRYLACKSVKDAQLAAYIGLIGTSVMELLAVSVGMTIFAYYYTCDPVTADEIDRSDKIVPYFMMDVFHAAPGVPGLLVGGAFCASLSSMSSVLNAFVSMTGQDIIKTVWPDMSERRYSMTVKVISVVYGVVTIALAFLASVLGDVLETALSIGGLTGGPTLGVFIIGLFFPRGNSVGAIAGYIGGTLVGLFFYIGSQLYPPTGHRPPLSVEGCAEFLPNDTSLMISDGMVTESYTTGPVSTDAPSTDLPGGPAIFGLSYLYLSTVTALSSLLLGLAVSYVTSRKHPQLAHPRLLAPIVARRMEATLDDDDGKDGKYSSKEYIPVQKI